LAAIPRGLSVIVSTQQAHANDAGGVIEATSLHELANDALKVSFDLGPQADPNLEIVRALDDIGPVATDHHKVLQILVNLLSNARHAVRDGTGKGRVTVRVRRLNNAHCAIEVEDTGCGIPAKNLTRVFNHGFTTKKDGHGFGLHVSSNLAAEIGGSLTARSDGPGRGAIFTLEIPSQATARAA
jgi:two-component system sensor kinase FixL